MINTHCPLKTCQAKNDADAAKCWNCGGPMPETAYNRPKAKLKTYAAKDVKIILHTPDGPHEIRGDEVEDGVFAGPPKAAFESLYQECSRIYGIPVDLLRPIPVPAKSLLRSPLDPDGHTPRPASSSKSDP